MIVRDAEIERNPLDDYVWLEDENFSFAKEKTTTNEGSIVHHLRMISQKWGNETLLLDLDQAIWQHRLDIIIPFNIVDSNVFLLHVTSKDVPLNFDSYHGDTLRTQKFGENLGVVTAVLYQVPNQPLRMTEIDGVQFQDLIYRQGCAKFKLKSRL